jgi:NADH-quinone oxidoreductase subunit J
MSIYVFFIFLALFFCSCCVIMSNNPIQSILFLILVFLFSAVLFMLLGAEFISLLILIVYIGAIAILFLFVIMMLNLRVVEVYNAFFHYLPIGSLVAFFFVGEFLMLIFFDFSKLDLLVSSNYIGEVIILKGYGFNNLHFFGYLLFSFYVHLFLIIGFVLFVSMIGSIVILVDVFNRGDKTYINNFDLNLKGLDFVILWNKAKLKQN